MLKKHAVEMLEGLANRLENRVCEWGGIVVKANIIDCPNIHDSLHLQILDEMGEQVCQFHIWEPGNDYPEHLYEQAFYEISLGIFHSMKAWKEFEAAMMRDSPFKFMGAPQHGGLLN